MVRWGKTQEGQPTVNDYVLLGEIGRGSYGKVQLCERRVGEPPWRRFAMKIVSKPRLRRLSEYVNVPSGGMKKVTAEDKVCFDRYELCHHFILHVAVLETRTYSSTFSDFHSIFRICYKCCVCEIETIYAETVVSATKGFVLKKGHMRRLKRQQ